MLSYMNSDLIAQTHSSEADLKRMYRRDGGQEEQRLLDGIAQTCVSIDIFVTATIISLIYFPEHASMIQNVTLYIMLIVYLAKQFGEFLVRFTSHRNYVNNNTMFAIRAVNHPNPGALFVCKLAWMNPQSFLDYRTCVVTLSFYEPPPPVSQAVEPKPAHPYNTRSKRRV